LLHYGDDTPYIPVNLDGKLLPFLLDTGAAVSVLPKGKLLPLLPKPLTSYSCPATQESRSITAFGGHVVAVEGPYVFPIEVLTHKLMHKFYVIDTPSSFIAGFDLVVAAHLIIDAVGRTVYTRSPATNSSVFASLDPISPPATNIAVLTSSNPRDKPSSLSPPPVPATLEPSTPPSALAAHEPSDSSQHPAVAPLTPCFNEPSLLPPSVPPGEPLSGPDAADSDVSEHLRVLFLTTLQEANLSRTLASEFKDLLVAHTDVFATSPTDIGFCDLLEHDIDTADAAPIRQPPRRPPLASGTAEDDLIAEILAAGVIEPFDSPWASPVCLAKKPDGSYRFCVDYGRVNAVSRKDAYPIPDMQDTFDSLRRGRNISRPSIFFQAIGK